MVKGIIQNEVLKALRALDIDISESEVVIDHPADLKFGDYSTNVAMMLAKKLGQNPKELAEQLANKLNEQKSETIAKAEAAGGFVNIFLSEKFFAESLKEILDKKENFGQNNLLSGQKTIVEYTDPNPFKEVHIGHLMSNTIGEAISRIVEANGTETKRACYQGDVGVHVAKAVWGIIDMQKAGEIKDLTDWEQIKKAYAWGAQKFEAEEIAKKEIYEINKKIYDRSDEIINSIYDVGRQKSLDYFETIYQKLNTKFDYYFYESKTGLFGRELVLEWLEKGIFEKSDGAVVFKGEQYDLYTRVFINSEGLPTYEAKELGLAKIKYDTYNYDRSIIITGNEVNNYFQVLLKAMSLIFPELAAKTKHIGHGMLRLPTGKMSSRTGDVITAESLIDKSKELILEKMKAGERAVENMEEVADQVAVGAIKYSILKQDIGRDIIYDFDKSLSFTGNSGPYLQYAFARTQSILEKAEKEQVKGEIGEKMEANDLEKLLYRFPEVVQRAGQEYAPHYICTYLFELANAFSSYYAINPIVTKETNSPYRVALTEAVGIVLKNGLRLLGIQAPQKM